ncbi:MAG: hypothetical protein ABII00_10765 [Elusimicrobiota bacterium]
MVELNAKCMFCGRSLLDESMKINSRSSIRVKISNGRKRGDLHLSSVYESCVTVSSIELTAGKIARFHCPYCNKELKDSRKCATCKAPLIPVEREEGGLILVCSRNGCKTPLFQFDDLELELKAFYESYPLFFK